MFSFWSIESRQSNILFLVMFCKVKILKFLICLTLQAAEANQVSYSLSGASDDGAVVSHQTQ